MAVVKTGLRILALAAALSVAGCSTLTGGDSDNEPAGAKSQFWRNTFMFGGNDAAPVVKQDDETRHLSCPAVSILDGTSAYRVGGNDGSNESVSYQASVVQFARECRVEGNTLYMRVGVEGRLLLGPQGRPGTFAIPVRIAVKDGDHAAYSTATRVSVTVPAGSDQMSFSHVQDGIALPIDDRDPGDRYQVLIGFDPSGAAPARRARHRR
jgi:hypothetical protein